MVHTHLSLPPCVCLSVCLSVYLSIHLPPLFTAAPNQNKQYYSIANIQQFSGINGWFCILELIIRFSTATNVRFTLHRMRMQRAKMMTPARTASRMIHHFTPSDGASNTVYSVVLVCRLKCKGTHTAASQWISNTMSTVKGKYFACPSIQPPSILLSSLIQMSC